MKLLESIEGAKGRALAWPILCDISDWLVGRVVDFAPEWSELEIEETFDFQQRGRKPECDTAVLVGFAHRTEDPLESVREFVKRVKAKQYVAHFLVKRDPNTKPNPIITLVEPEDANAFRVEVGVKPGPSDIRAADARRAPTEWYLRIDGKDVEGLRDLDPNLEAPDEEPSQDAVESTEVVPVWDMEEEE